MEESTKNTELAIAVCSDARESEALENLNDRALLYNKDDNTLGVKYDGSIHKSAPLKNNKIPEEFLPGPILMYRGTFETEPVYESPNTPKEGDVWAATTNTTLSNGLKVIAGSVIFRKNGDWAPLGGGSGSVNSINKTGEKLYLLGATTQDEAVETFSNENVYIDEDGVIQGTAAFANTSGYAEMAEFSSSAEMAAFASEAQSAETAKSAETAAFATEAQTAQTAETAQTANSAIYDGDGNEISKTYVPLDENNRISYQYLPESAMEFKGAWTPTSDGAAPSSNPTKGDFYIIAMAGSVAGEDYNANDRTIYDGTKWVKLPGGDSSINDETQSHTTTWSSEKIQTEISNVKVDLTAATSSELGGIKLGYTIDLKNKKYPVELQNEKAYVHVPWEEYRYLQPVENGTSYTLVTTGEKYTWESGAVRAESAVSLAFLEAERAAQNATATGNIGKNALAAATSAAADARSALASASKAGKSASDAAASAESASDSATGMASATSAAAKATSSAASATSAAAAATSAAAQATSTASLALPKSGGTMTGTLTTQRVTIGSGYNLILSKNASTTEGAIWYT